MGGHCSYWKGKRKYVQMWGHSSIMSCGRFESVLIILVIFANCFLIIFSLTLYLSAADTALRYSACNGSKVAMAFLRFSKVPNPAAMNLGSLFSSRRILGIDI